jgi:hypothetical protein
MNEKDHAIHKATAGKTKNNENEYAGQYLIASNDTLPNGRIRKTTILNNVV